MKPTKKFNQKNQTPSYLINKNKNKKIKSFYTLITKIAMRL